LKTGGTIAGGETTSANTRNPTRNPQPQALELCPPVQDAVARLCCAWWAAGGPDKEELLSQTLPFLLVRAAAPLRLQSDGCAARRRLPVLTTCYRSAQSYKPTPHLQPTLPTDPPPQPHHPHQTTNTPTSTPTPNRSARSQTQRAGPAAWSPAWRCGTPWGCWTLRMPRSMVRGWVGWGVW